MADYMVHHLARCGSHAIMNWMGRQMEPITVCFNNVNEKLEQRSVEIHEENKRWIDGDLSGFEGDIRNRIYSTENFDFRGYGELNTSDIDTTIIILRDPKNWIASSLNIDGYLSDLYETYQSQAMQDFGYSKWFCASLNRLEMYKQYLREAIGITKHITNETVNIYYNYWFLDRDYREKIANDLGFEFTDEGFDFKPSYGGGSSFDIFDPMNRYEQIDYDVNEFIDEDMMELHEEYLEHV